MVPKSHSNYLVGVLDAAIKDRRQDKGVSPFSLQSGLFFCQLDTFEVRYFHEDNYLMNVFLYMCKMTLMHANAG